MHEKLRILLVDDEIDYLESLSCLLSRRGIEVHTASSGHAALAILETNEFDCVVLDLYMPIMDGRETLEQMRKKDPLTPVILLTGRGDMTSVLRALRAGQIRESSAGIG